MHDLLKGIKNIIFDFGGVILNIDMPRCLSAFQELGLKDSGLMYLSNTQLDLFPNLEKGKITDKEFYSEVRRHLNVNVSDSDIQLAWNKMILDIPAERIRIIDSLNKGTDFRTFLLSNTNAIHYEYYTNNLYKEYGFKDFAELFEKDYFSHKLKMMKPGREIFEFVLYDAGLNASETLFIDDSPANIKGAEALGIRSFLLPPDFGIVELFPDLL